MFGWMCQVFSRVFILRENVDLGWSMLGLENQEAPPQSLLTSVEKVVDALTELHVKEQDLAFKKLGYPQGDASEARSTLSPVNLDELEIPQMSQIVGSQFQHQLDWSQIDISPDVGTGERERRVLCEHIKMPAPVIMDDGRTQWHRKTPCHLDLRDGQGSGSRFTSMRLLEYGDGGEGSFEEAAAALIDGEIHGAALASDEVHIGDEEPANGEAAGGGHVVHAPATEEIHTPSR